MSKKSLTVIERNLKILDGQEKLEESGTILEVINSLDNELKNSVELPRQLVHFLKQRSYQKALHFIQNEYEQGKTN